jgi:stage II sporulation protein D
MNRQAATRAFATIGLAALATCTRPANPEPVVVAIPVYSPPDSQPTMRRVPDAPTRRPMTPPNTRLAVRDVGDTTIRILLSSKHTTVQIAAPGHIEFLDRVGNLLTRGAASGSESPSWHFESEGRRIRAVRSNGTASRWTDGSITAQSGDAGLLSVGGKPYRGTIVVYASDSGMSIVNVARIDDYLRGVVPIEIGTSSLDDSAAVQAQAVTARSYAYIHLTPNRFYDVTAGTLDQVYGGVAAETAVGSEAVESTRTLVLEYAGRIVNAPYSSTCGGRTAAASEIWRTDDEPYLQSVSDEIPGTGRYYCDIAPRYRWTRTLDGPQLNAALARYLANYVSVPGRRPGVAQSIVIGSRTPSGRVGTLVVTTDRGRFTLRGNDIRYVMRPPGGEILNSTYFSVGATRGSDGAIGKLTLTGTGYGHGVGMCQWGAIGRARAGQDFRTILRTYYPGTTVGPPQ